MISLADQSDDTVGAQPPITRPGRTWQLPVELLLQCLLASDMVTRIRANHVCRTWCEVALAERRLWNTFSCSRYRNKQHEAAMFSALQAFLLRSRPLPFHLKIPEPHRLCDLYYPKRFLALEAFDIRRLAGYQGPVRVFEQLNPARDPLPVLACHELESYGSEYTTVLELEARLGSHCLPNLQELRVPSVGFPADSIPFLALQSVTIACMHGIHHRALFAHCPRLVRLDIADSPMGTPLPDPPIPPTLEEVSIRFPRLVVREVYSLRDVLPLFLVLHMHTIEMRLPAGAGDVVLAAIPDDKSVWSVSPSPPWAADFLSSIEKLTSHRVTSITISFSRLGELLRAQLHVRGLETLDLRLDSADADTQRLEISSRSFLRAPQLRSVCFNRGEDCASPPEDAFYVLRSSFLSMFIYDAEFLDTITVSRKAERVCAGFAPLAKDYVVVYGRF